MRYHPGFYQPLQPSGLKQDHLGLHFSGPFGRISIENDWRNPDDGLQRIPREAIQRLSVMLGDRRTAAKVEAQLSIHNRSES